MLIQCVCVFGHLSVVVVALMRSFNILLTLNCIIKLKPLYFNSILSKFGEVTFT